MVVVAQIRECGCSAIMKRVYGVVPSVHVRECVIMPSVQVIKCG